VLSDFRRLSVRVATGPSRSSRIVSFIGKWGRGEGNCGSRTV
jgi:hypothetical protein